ncbi:MULTISPECIES: HD domain-containing protein [Arthrobacter]|uniref:HD domain-containing protein n=1 Tax=Arthrobacter gengyunqii TaxID=2886940 RepID=A0ABS8GE18_9MICC|nr:MULTISPECIES: HD domain-containing protein [Arthrobacter]MBO0895321.1 HD domain-containing protein [Arthrobacter sunyaminii]MCC3264810.1 HD domain-containing protein [Arthrobacter gengyunqii]
MDNLITNAERVARAAHEGQTDKTGVPYITHPERVARTAAQRAPEHLREEAQAVAWLHDTVEDTGVTLQGLREQGFPETVVAGVDAMTKRQGEPVESYFERVRANNLARIVKAADIDDNTNPERVQKLDQADRTRLAAKYQRSRELLTLE